TISKRDWSSDVCSSDLEIRDPNYDFVRLFSSVVWGNTQVFLPISLVMTGGWMIDREHTSDTMKNLLAVPVSYHRLLGGKLAVAEIGRASWRAGVRVAVG